MTQTVHLFVIVDLTPQTFSERRTDRWGRPLETGTRAVLNGVFFSRTEADAHVRTLQAERPTGTFQVIRQGLQVPDPVHSSIIANVLVPQGR